MMNDDVTIPKEQFDAILEDAAERGAKRALADIGLSDKDAPEDIRDLRGLLDAMRTVRGEALRASVRFLTNGVILVFLLGLAVKAGVFEFFTGGK